MPDNKVFEIRTISNESKTELVNNAVSDWRKYVTQLIEELENTSSKQVRLLCYFSLIESIAQDLANYSGNMHRIFVDFILKYQTKYSYINFIDPITLFYRGEEHFGCKLNLSDFEDGQVYNPQDKFVRDKALSIIEVLSDIKGAEEANRLAKDHRYVNLLYRLRCRLSHEFSSSHISISSQHEEPYYMNCGRYYVNKQGNAVQDDVWQLYIPVEFVRNICMNCIENYLDDCLKNNTLPISNDSMDRFCELSWYNKRWK